MKCQAQIRSPWRMGMFVQCSLEPDHPGLHQFHSVSYSGLGEVVVQWKTELGG